MAIFVPILAPNNFEARNHLNISVDFPLDRSIPSSLENFPPNAEKVS